MPINRILSELHNRYSDIIDWVYPSVPTRRPKDVEVQTAKDEERISNDIKVATDLPDNINRLTDAIKDAETLITQEEQRKQSVEARLSTIIGLVSVVATLTLALLSFRINKDTASVSIKKISIIVGLTVYVTLQLFIALLAAIKGLQRTGYQNLSITDVLPTDRSNSLQIRELLKKKIKVYHILQDRINSKVTQMAVAHRALQNFLLGILLMVVFLGVFDLAEKSQSPTPAIGTETSNKKPQGCPVIYINTNMHKDVVSRSHRDVISDKLIQCLAEETHE